MVRLWDVTQGREVRRFWGHTDGVLCVAFTADGRRVLSGGGDRIFRVYGGITFNINGAITGTGNVRHTDGGTLALIGNNSFTGNLISAGGSGRIIALSGANTYTGITHIVNGSTVRLDANNTLPDTSAVLMYANATFNANGRTDTFRGLFVGSAGDANSTVNLGGAGSTGTLKAAVQTVEGKSVVFVRTPEGFEKREVELGRSDDDAVEVASGLKPGDEIAVGNTFLLKAELGKSEADHDH